MPRHPPHPAPARETPAVRRDPADGPVSRRRSRVSRSPRAAGSGSRVRRQFAHVRVALEPVARERADRVAAPSGVADPLRGEQQHVVGQVDVGAPRALRARTRLRFSLAQQQPGRFVVEHGHDVADEGELAIAGAVEVHRAPRGVAELGGQRQILALRLGDVDEAGADLRLGEGVHGGTFRDEEWGEGAAMRRRAAHERGARRRGGLISRRR